MGKDLVGEAWEDIKPHIQDDLRRGAFMSTRFEVELIGLVAIPMEDEPVHELPEHPFCQDPFCPCHENLALIEEFLTVPLQEGLLTEHEAERLFQGE